MNDKFDLERIATALEKIATAMPWALLWLFCIALGTCSGSDSVDDLRAELKKTAPTIGQTR
jgi:hypothetical protein